MRLRGPLVAVLLASFVWLGCEDHQALQEEANPLGPVFAKGGAECDTKGAPVRDYFTSKATQQYVNELFRELATQCADQNEAGTLTAGFKILRAVEEARADGLVGDDPADGALVVSVAWRLMEPFACSGSPCPADLGKLTKSLTDEGAFAVRGTGYPGYPENPDYPDPIGWVYSWGNVAEGVPYWGVEPFGAASWSGVITGNIGLVFGYPDYDATTGGVGEEALGLAVAYDWNVLPGTTGPLSVTMCADAPEGKKEKLAHGGALLQDGNDGDALCAYAAANDPLAGESLGSQVIRLASAVIPFWPQELHATVKGGSASGKATEFSPYFGYQLDPEGLVEFITIPGNATAYYPDTDGVPSGSNLICASGVTIPDEATICPPGSEIRVHLTTSNRSRLYGDETVLIVVTAEDNNGSWEMHGTFVGVRDEDPGFDLEGEPYGLVYQWDDLALDKPGAYKLHTYRTDADGNVFDDNGNPVEVLDEDGIVVDPFNSVGIAFPAASSVKFNVNP